MIVGAMLARNEAAEDRYLERVLTNMFTFCDEVVLLDDHSEDSTPTIATTLGCHVHTSGATGAFWGHDETSRRAELWGLAADLGGSTGWIYIADADMELIDVTPDEVRMLCRAEQVNAWAWTLLDCWDSDETHRVDGFWQAWRTPRPWLFRAAPEPGFTPSWHQRGIHAGHAPANYPYRLGFAPGRIRHLSYVNPAHRRAKAENYLELAGTDPHSRS